MCICIYIYIYIYIVCVCLWVFVSIISGMCARRLRASQQFLALYSLLQTFLCHPSKQTNINIIMQAGLTSTSFALSSSHSLGDQFAMTRREQRKIVLREEDGSVTFRPFRKLYDRPTDRPTNQQTGMKPGSYGIIPIIL